MIEENRSTATSVKQKGEHCTCNYNSPTEPFVKGGRVVLFPAGTDADIECKYSTDTKLNRKENRTVNAPPRPRQEVGDTMNDYDVPWVDAIIVLIMCAVLLALVLPHVMSLLGG